MKCHGAQNKQNRINKINGKEKKSDKKEFIINQAKLDFADILNKVCWICVRFINYSSFSTKYIF